LPFAVLQASDQKEVEDMMLLLLPPPLGEVSKRRCTGSGRNAAAGATVFEKRARALALLRDQAIRAGYAPPRLLEGALLSPRSTLTSRHSVFICLSES
jgi:hypothetical protein